MAIAFDSAQDGTELAGGTSGTLSFNNVAGNLVVAAVYADNSFDNVTGCTWNGSAMTKLATLTNAQSSNGRYSYFFYILSAATGTHNIVCSASSADAFGITAASYSGVSNTGQPDASTTNSSSAQANLTTSVTTVADNSWTILAEFAYDGGSTPTAGAGSTRRAVNSSFGTTGLFDSNGPITPAGSTSMNTERTFTVSIGHIMASFKPDVGGGGGRTTKNTRGWGLGTELGMGIWMPNEL
jgi:hypothetical protein